MSVLFACSLFTISLIPLENQIDGSTLKEVTNSDLRDMDLTLIGPNKKLLRLIAELYPASTCTKTLPPNPLPPNPLPVPPVREPSGPESSSEESINEVMSSGATSPHQPTEPSAAGKSPSNSNSAVSFYLFLFIYHSHSIKLWCSFYRDSMSSTFCETRGTLALGS